MAFAEDYVDVASRLAEFREKHPDGALQPADLAIPYRVETIGDQTLLIVVAAAYRSPEDKLPGIGMAQEVFPGKTPYTRGSELQNAETSAWGRAIVAALRADTKRGIASADEVRNRTAERETFDDAPQPPVDPRAETRAQIKAAGEERGWTVAEIGQDFAGRTSGKDIRSGSDAELSAYLNWMRDQPSKWESGAVAS